MFTEKNFVAALELMNFEKISEGVYQKVFAENIFMQADFKNKKFIYPAQLKNREKNNLLDSTHKENFVVFECINRLLEKGYKPEHIELEKAWHLGHDAKSGRADICISNSDDETFCIVECKTFGKEFYKELKNLQEDGGQLFSYWQQERACKWLVLYTSTFGDDKKIISKSETVDCSDDKNILTAAEKNPEMKTYKNSYTVENLYDTWADTYEKKLLGDLFFNDDTAAYEIGIKPLKYSKLKDITELDGIVNKFEEILRHNNISDYPNAFNRLIALFICKLVDETQNAGTDNELSFQYKIGSDSYEILQDRLQRLHRDGMEKFMDEKIFYLPDDYAKNLVQQIFGQDRDFMLQDLQSNLRKLKFFTNNDFAFKEVHNEELFYQNGKVLVEMVRLFQNFKIINPNNLQTLGDLFEQLLDKGFKQNEGQFFTPTPITRFIWDSLPLEKIISDEPPKIIDYACGAGHFLTQGFKAINDFTKNTLPEGWEDRKLFGIEKDYRLARVSRISFFMHGANKGSVIFGDGLENNFDKYIRPADFDILVSNPPYSIKGFKPHLKLENKFDTLEKISNDGSEIEILFVERIAQLLKPCGIAAVILPSSILNKDGKSFVSAREKILQNFYVRAIAEFGSKTFSATGTKTDIIFLEKLEDTPKRFNLLRDSVVQIFRDDIREDFEDSIIFDSWLEKIKVAEDVYKKFIHREKNYSEWKDDFYFGEYVAAFENSSEYKNKIGQVTFQNLSDEEKISWLNQKFYDFAHKIEKEKIHYFAQTYDKTTLIISAPDKNDEQEKFLGYSWSNRKGDEGIKIKNPGGLLYDEKNRRAENKLAFAVRKIFSGEKVQIPDAQNYFNYFQLSDLIDFSGANFTKNIILSKVSDERLSEERFFPTQKLEKFVEINVATFDPTKTPEEKFFYVDISAIDSATNKINFSNEIFGKDAPSRARRIANDGDILISTVRPNLKSFALIKNSPKNTLYSTGFAILNSKDKNFLLNEFIFCLFMNDPILMEQMKNKMTKAAYPSINQNDIKNFQILVPSVEEQKKIVGEFESLDEKISAQEKIILDGDAKIKNKFAEMFGEIEEKISIGECCEIEKGTNLTREQAAGGKIPVVAGGILPSCYHNVANREKNIITISASGQNAGFVNFWREKIFATDCNTLKNKKNFSIEFIFFALKNIQEKIFELQRGSAQPHVYGNDIAKILIPNAPKELQEKFSEFVKSVEEEKNSARNLKEKFLLEREELVKKYFR